MYYMHVCTLFSLMELLDLFLLSILFLLFLFFLLSFLPKPKSAGNDDKHDQKILFKLPPGSKGWPIIGETFDFMNRVQKGTPEKFIQDRTHKYSPNIFKTSLFGEPMAVLCGSSGNKFLFSNENKLVRSWWPGNFDNILRPSLSIPRLDLHNKLRRVMLDCLKHEALQSYTALIDSHTKTHLETNWDNRSEVFVYPSAGNYTLSLGFRLFLGIDDPSRSEEIVKQFSFLLSGIFSVPINLPGTRFNRAIKAMKSIRKMVIPIVKQKKIDLADQKKASPVQDILSHVLLTSDEETEEMEIVDLIIGLIIGSYEATNSTITLVMMYLAEHPDVYNKVLREQIEIVKSKGPGDQLLNREDIQKMKYSWNVACETLRLTPPASGTFREAITDFSYGGFSVPKGWKLFWSASWTHKNPEYFPEPERFDPSRFEGNGPAPFTFVPFGGGPRMCPGKEYAKLLVLVFMHNAVTKYKWEKLIPEEKIAGDPLMFPAKGLPIRLQHKHI